MTSGPVILIFSMLISFIGMIPAGLINSAVMLKALRVNMKQAMLLASGAVFVECAHIMIALLAVDILLDQGPLFDTLRWVSVGIFLAFALYFFIKRNVTPRRKSSKESGNSFIQGIAVSNLNILAVPFWAFYATWLETSHMVGRAWDHWPFILIGAALGSLATLYFYGRMAGWLDRRFQWFQNRINLILSFIFLGLTIFTLIRLL